MARQWPGEVGGGKGRCVCRVTVGPLRVTVTLGQLWVTLHLRATMGHLRMTIGHLRETIHHFFFYRVSQKKRVISKNMAITALKSFRKGKFSLNATG